MGQNVESCNQIEMYRWNSVEQAVFRISGEITNAFLRLGISDLRQAARHVQMLPYRRNVHPDNPLAVLEEQVGTCSTKHALMCRLAHEQHVETALIVGIYEMSERNTPGVGVVLHRYGLPSLPEAHCYIRLASRRIDLTGIPAGPDTEPITHFLFETEIEPDQILDHKAAIHRHFLELWCHQDGRQQHTLQELWSIREECIAALSSQATIGSGEDPSCRPKQES
jgi:hypothetical protein